MKPRADTQKSAPMQTAQATLAGFTSLPEAMTLTRSRRPCALSLSTTSGRLSRSGRPTSSISGIGAAPVPPSAPSTVMKSGADSTPRRLISTHSSSSQPHAPMTLLKPTGLPVSSRIRAIIASRSSTELMSGWRFGLIESWPSRMPRMRAISALTLAPGRMPPLPGLAPCDSLISNMRTLSCAASSRSLSSERLPSRSRTPYLAVPICTTRSQPVSR